VKHITDEENQTAHWHILGAGSIGCLFGFWLRNRSTLILRSENFRPEILNPASSYAEKNTLTLSIEKNNLRTSFTLPCTTTDKASNIQNLLICTKANQTQEAIAHLKLNDACNIVLLQNGMGNIEVLKQQFPQCTIFCGSTTHGAYRRSGFDIVHAGEGLTHIGTFDKNVSQQALENICSSLSSEEQIVNVDLHIEKRLWIKLAMNCAINPLTVIYQCKNGALLETPEPLHHLKSICTELDIILHLKNYLSTNESCFNLVKQVANDTANNYSSMYQDHSNKRPSEIDFIQGFLLKEAQALNLALPLNKTLFDTIKKIEAYY